jgi:glutamate-5-semialdehyde dehydrogenase
MIDLNNELLELKTASHQLAILSEDDKNNALTRVADSLWRKRRAILEANQSDVSLAKQNGIHPALIDRLLLNEERWRGVVSDLRQVIKLPDPIGEQLDTRVLPNGLQVTRKRVPIGVVAVIYEARPNVTVDVTGLTLKSGNAVILRGGKETLVTNGAIVQVMKDALRGSAIPEKSIFFLDNPDRELLLQLMKRYDLVDMLIPRGGADLHKFCRENSMIPVITGGIGICHLFVDANVDVDKAIEVIRNAKIQRPTVCNALDTLLVHAAIAQSFIPRVISELRKDRVSFYLDKNASHLISTADDIYLAEAGDFDREWLSLNLGIIIVPDVDGAIEHIRQHGTSHSDGILSSDIRNSEKFLLNVDSAAVYVNASTRFTDGSALGLGAEIAVSTQKLHARGPMALEELTSYKWVIQGDYQVKS